MIKLKFENHECVEPVGRAGGMWMLWNSTKANILFSTEHLIHAWMEDKVKKNTG